MRISRPGIQSAPGMGSQSTKNPHPTHTFAHGRAPLSRDMITGDAVRGGRTWMLPGGAEASVRHG
jgi:hypothetical protein